MIYKEELLNGIKSSLKEGVVYLDWYVGGMFNVQVVASSNSQDLEALIAQGGKLSAVNEAREKIGLHKLGMNFNQKIISENWSDKLKTGEGVVVKMQNGPRAIKLNKIFEAAIDEAKTVYSDLEFDIQLGASFDTIFVYLKGAEAKKKESPKKEPEKK